MHANMLMNEGLLRASQLAVVPFPSALALPPPPSLLRRLLVRAPFPRVLRLLHCDISRVSARGGGSAAGGGVRMSTFVRL